MALDLWGPTQSHCVFMLSTVENRQKYLNIQSNTVNQG